MGANLAPGARKELAAAADAGWKGPEVLGLVESRQRTGSLPPAANSCTGAPACLEPLAAGLGVQVVVVGSVGEELGTYTGVLRALRPAGGAVLAESTWGCEICTLREATAALTKEAGRFRGVVLAKLGPPAGLELTVETHPAGATALVDGVSRGTTPLTITLPPGQYLLRLKRKGYRATERLVDLTGAPQRLEFGLRPSPAGPAVAAATPAPSPPASAPAPPGVLVPRPPAAPTAPPPSRATSMPPEAPEAPAGPGPSTGSAWGGPVLGYTGLGLGLASTALGAVLIALDGEATCDGAVEDCETLYDTGTSGIVFSVLGGALLAGSAVFFVAQGGAAQPAGGATTGAGSGVGSGGGFGLAAGPSGDGGWMVVGRGSF